MISLNPPSRGVLSEIATSVRRTLPRGQTLPYEAWERRHRVMVWILWAHVPGLAIFALLRGASPAAALGGVVPIALAGIAAMLPGPGRRARSVAVVLGLLTASAVLVNIWDGRIEAHFHFFVMIAVLALYEDWLPFGLAIIYVVVEHGVVGVVAPHSVYDHGGNPWAWAGVHGGFVLAAAAASVTTWRLNEDMRARMDHARREARATAARFQHAFESGVTGMALVSTEGHYLSVNRALCEITGYPEEELLGMDFQSITHPEDLGTDLEHLHALLSGAVELYETEKRYLHREGHIVWVQIGVSAVRSDDGEVEYLISQLHDITERRRVEDELAHQALHDPLTGLPNRALFLDRLRHAIVRMRRHTGQAAVLFVDLDRFKLVNDTLGHKAGDVVLAEAAKRLREASRAEDTVARFGGDEFTILCDDAGEEEAKAVAKRVLSALSRPFAHAGQEFHLSASIGIRISDHATADPDSLLRDADMALYVAKEHGRARFEVFDPAARTNGVNVLATSQALRLALRNDELCLHYQPCVDLKTGRIVSLEALVRWRHPERGLVPPGEFIPAAEESGLITPIGEWVLRKACSQLAAWRANGVAPLDMRVAVNVSARQLSDPDLPDTVAAALGAAELDPTALCLEITESAVIRDPVMALANLLAIKKLGAFIALDDFGVGFSSLSQIRELPPVDMIKLDRSFTAGLGRNASDTAVVTAVLSLARSLDLTAVAEGIETTYQLDRLRELECDVGQGFYFSRPQPADKIKSVLAEPLALVPPRTLQGDPTAA
jgi:diguanylate cyclase (GGDEF)-like protein/PAS domain S-box-containing protein